MKLTRNEKAVLAEIATALERKKSVAIRSLLNGLSPMAGKAIGGTLVSLQAKCFIRIQTGRKTVSLSKSKIEIMEAIK